MLFQCNPNQYERKRKQYEMLMNGDFTKLVTVALSSVFPTEFVAIPLFPIRLLRPTISE